MHVRRNDRRRRLHMRCKGSRSAHRGGSGDAQVRLARSSSSAQVRRHSLNRSLQGRSNHRRGAVHVRGSRLGGSASEFES